MEHLLGWGFAVGLMALREMSCCGLVRSSSVCPAGAEQLFDHTAVVGWLGELEVWFWALPCGMASTEKQLGPVWSW